MKIAIIGCGVMGSAFARGWADQHELILFDRNAKKVKELAIPLNARVVSDLQEAVKAADVVLLAIKPKDLRAIIDSSQGGIWKDKILVSLLSGASVAKLKEGFPSAHVVRIMPNLGLIYEKGVIGLVNDPDLASSVRKCVDQLMQGLGLNVWIDESKIDSLIALSGSGIAFVLVMIEAMIDGGVYLGFSAQDSREIVFETLLGAVALVKESGKHPAELKLQISSPAGTTASGLKAMEEHRVRFGILQTMQACYERAISITREVEGSPSGKKS